MAVFSNKMYISVKGNSGEIFTNSTSNGTSWGSWDQSGGKTGTPISLEVYQGSLYQSIRGNSTNRIYTRRSTNGTTWTNWSEDGGLSPSRPTLVSFNNVLHQFVRGNSDQMFVRSR